MKDMLKWILSGLGTVCLIYGAFTFPWSTSGQATVTWSGLISLFDLFVGVAIIGGLLGWHANDIADFLR